MRSGRLRVCRSLSQVICPRNWPADANMRRVRESGLFLRTALRARSYGRRASGLLAKDGNYTPQAVRSVNTICLACAFGCEYRQIDFLCNNEWPRIIILRIARTHKTVDIKEYIFPACSSFVLDHTYTQPHNQIHFASQPGVKQTGTCFPSGKYKCINCFMQHGNIFIYFSILYKYFPPTDFFFK